MEAGSSSSSSAAAAAAAAASRSSETPALAQRSAAATDADVKPSSKGGVVLKSAKGPIDSKMANTVASEW